MIFSTDAIPPVGLKRNLLNLNAHTALKGDVSILIRVVKLTGLIILISSLHVSATGNAQEQMTFYIENVAVEKLFSEIERKTGYIFLYDVTILRVTKPVTVEFQNATMDEVLRQRLIGQTSKYTINDKTIFVNIEYPGASLEQGQVAKAGR
jgi:hypothetical protein